MDEGLAGRPRGRTSELAEAVLGESEARFRAFVTASTDVVYRMNPDWTEMCGLDGRGFIPDTDAISRSWIEDYFS